MEDFFEPTETLWKNLGQTLIRHKNDVDGKQIELNIEASTDELREVLEYAVTTGFLLNIVELPDTEEYDSFTDFLFFCKKIADAAPKEEEPEMQTVQVRLMVSERELKSVGSMLTESVTLMARNKDLTNKNADRLLLIENFRRKIMNAATAPLNPPQGGKCEEEGASDDCEVKFSNLCADDNGKFCSICTLNCKDRDFRYMAESGLCPKLCSWCRWEGKCNAAQYKK